MDLTTLALAKKLAGSGGGSGTPGRGIQKIEKTNTEGLVDTYTITYTDGSTSTFTVTNGKDGEDATAAATVPVYYITGNSADNPFICADHEPGIYIFDQYEVYAVATSTDTITDDGYPLHTMDGVLNYVTKFEEGLTDLTPLGIYMSYNGWNMEMIYSEMATSTGRIFRRTSDNAGELSRYPLIATAEDTNTGIRNIIGLVRISNASQFYADAFNGDGYQFINKKLLDQYVEDNNLGESGGTSDYNDLTNQPQIDGVTLVGNKALSDLGIQPSSDNTLSTTDKTIAGAINELYSMITTISSTIDEINGEVV